MTGHQLDQLLADAQLDPRPQVAALRRAVIATVAALRTFVDLGSDATAGDVFALADGAPRLSANEIASNVEGLATELQVVVRLPGPVALLAPGPVRPIDVAGPVPGEAELHVEAQIMASAR